MRFFLAYYWSDGTKSSIALYSPERELPAHGSRERTIFLPNLGAWLELDAATLPRVGRGRSFAVPRVEPRLAREPPTARVKEVLVPVDGPLTLEARRSAQS